MTFSMIRAMRRTDEHTVDRLMDRLAALGVHTVTSTSWPKRHGRGLHVVRVAVGGSTYRAEASSYTTALARATRDAEAGFCGEQHEVAS